MISIVFIASAISWLSACGSGDSSRDAADAGTPVDTEQPSSTDNTVVTDTGDDDQISDNNTGSHSDNEAENNSGNNFENNTENGTNTTADTNTDSDTTTDTTPDTTTDSDSTGNVDGDNTSSDNSNSSQSIDNTDLQPDIQSAGRPNILLVITDDQGLDSSAQYSLSNDVPDTPIINSLAANGITYDNAWATPSCTTTRAALLTGKHGVNNGVPQTPGILSPDIGTIQAYLQQQSNLQNYKTAVFGKWHVAGGSPDPDHPQALGIDHYSGNLTGNLTDYFEWDVTTNGQSSVSNTYHTTALVDFAAQWISEQDAPWFTWLAFSAPHSPFHAPPAEFNGRGLSGTEADIAARRRDYFLSAIETLDTELGRLLDSMDSATRENTLVVVIGDNGTPRTVIDRSAYIASHGKGSLFEGGVRVPLVISGAGVSRSNVRESGLVSIVDFFPTIATLAGLEVTDDVDGYSLVPSFSSANALTRPYNYTEFSSDQPLGSGWTVRSNDHKYLAYTDGSEALYDLLNDPDETVNLLETNNSMADVSAELIAFGQTIRGETEAPTAAEALIITDGLLTNTSGNCEDHVRTYIAMATDASTGTTFDANLDVTVSSSECIFSSNGIPNHPFNDGDSAFPNIVDSQVQEFRVARHPQAAAGTTALSLTYDNAILLNGVKVDLLAAGCFGIGNGKVGCNDSEQAWRYDPMHLANGFNVDQHNAHVQSNGTYHYHGSPLALFDSSGTSASPVVGFAADGFPIYGSFFSDSGSIRKALSSYQLRTGARPQGSDDPGGNYDGSFRDDYIFVDGSGDLDACNGMTHNGQYAYYITDNFPYIVGCFTGTVNESFRK